MVSRLHFWREDTLNFKKATESTNNGATPGFDEKYTIFLSYLLPDRSPEPSRVSGYGN